MLQVGHLVDARTVMENIVDLAEFLKRRHLVLVTAESCTAGLIAALLGDVPGAGQVLDCSYVTYSPEAKQRLLGLSDELLDRHNLTSEPIARAMADGAIRRSGTNLAVSNTGLADKGDDDIPAGTQCFAWAFRLREGDDASIRIFTETRRFPGDRTQVRTAAARFALSRIPYYYEQLPGGKP